MLPPIKYKVHPKMLEIQEEKRKRRLLLEQARDKQSEQLSLLKVDRQQYMKQNKEQIKSKQEAIYQIKLVKRNKIRQEDLTRAERVAQKKSELLLRLIPERRQMIDAWRREHMDAVNRQDQRRRLYVQKKIQQKLEQQSQLLRQTQDWGRQQKMRQNNIIDTNDGICVLCLTSEAEIFMVACRHLISCKDCEFMIRMNKKCPLCRANSNYENMKQKNRKQSRGSKKSKSLHKQQR